MRASTKVLFLVLCSVGSLAVCPENGCSGGGPCSERCCFTDRPCQDLSPDECARQGGTPGGAGSSCDSVRCPELGSGFEDPTMPTWIADRGCDVQGNVWCGVHLAHRWGKRQLTYSFHNFSNNDVKARIETAYRQACVLWQSVTPLSFSEVDSNGDIQIYRVDKGDPDYTTFRMDVFPAVAELPSGGDRPVTQRIDDDITSTWSGNLAVMIAAHEIGHGLGVTHLVEPNAIMHERLFDDGAVAALHPADIEAIQEVYGKPDAVTAPPIEIRPLQPLTSLPPPGDDDPDGDGLNTFTELLLTWPTGKKCDPNNADTDGDGLPDGYEMANGLDPTNPDSNGNGVGDKTEIEQGTDPRAPVVVLDPGNVAIRDEATLCTLPTVGQGKTVLGLSQKDYLRAGFAAGDTATVVATGTNKSVSNVEIMKWGEDGCSAWLTQDMWTAMGLAPGTKSELLIRRTCLNCSDLAVTLVYPTDGDYVPGEADLVVRIQGGNGQRLYLQPFVLATDPWRYYPQDAVEVRPIGTTVEKARIRLGHFEAHDGLTFKVWAELRSEPAPIVLEGLPGFPQGCLPPCSRRSPAITVTRGQRDTDGDCIADDQEIRGGTNPYDAQDPRKTPPSVVLDEFADLGRAWWWTVPGIVPQVVTRADGLDWLKVDWSFEGSDSQYAYVSRRLDPPLRMAYCQKLKADVQVFGSQRLKAEIKVSNGQGGFDWVRTETFALEAGTRDTIVVDLPKRWGEHLEHEGIIDVAEVSFTIDRRYDNPVSGTYWVRNIRITGRPCLLDGTCPSE